MTGQDYNVCPGTDDGIHVPTQGFDPGMPDGYLTVQCSECGQTTGTAIPAAADLEWN